MKAEKATFAAGCFWGVEEAFRTLPGVIETRVGYTGGHTKDPTYKEVCTDTTGHAEALEVTFDPSKTSYEKLLAEFWKIHDPTTMNRQGPDVGSQYRSAIFYHDEGQKRLAEISKRRLGENSTYKNPIVTEIAATTKFYPAEEYHQKYILKGGAAACHI